VEATRVCIPIGNSEVLLAAVYKSGMTLTSLSSLALDANLFWHRVRKVSNMKDEELLSTIRMEIHVKAQTNCVISSTSGGYYVY
jgi:hypothetical protein